MFWRNVLSPPLGKRMGEGNGGTTFLKRSLIIYQAKKCHIPENSTLENTYFHIEMTSFWPS
jgi:hypothetical protein